MTPRDEYSTHGISWQIMPVDALPGCTKQWNWLVEAARYPGFMYADFISEAIETFGCESGVLALAFRSDEVVAGGVFQKSGPGRWAVFQPSQLPLGAWIMRPTENWGGLLSSLSRSLPGVCLLLSVSQQDPFLVARPSHTSRMETLDYVQTGWIDVDGTFEQFWASRGKNVRQGLPKLRRRLESSDGPLSFSFVDGQDSVRDAIESFASLESSGWKAAGGTAITADNQQGDFYRAAMNRLSRRGSGFAFFLSQNGRVIAVDFGVRDGDRMVLLKTTYDESLKSYSPGQLLHHMFFDYAFSQEGIRRIEFYGKLMEWHSRWTKCSRMLYHVNYFPWSFIRSLRWLRAKLGR